MRILLKMPTAVTYFPYAGVQCSREKICISNVRHVVAFREYSRLLSLRLNVTLTHLVWRLPKKKIPLGTLRKFSKSSSNRFVLSKMPFSVSELRGLKCPLTIAKHNVYTSHLPVPDHLPESILWI
jgi:hypothetical protein